MERAEYLVYVPLKVSSKTAREAKEAAINLVTHSSFEVLYEDNEDIGGIVVDLIKVQDNQPSNFAKKTVYADYILALVQMAKVLEHVPMNLRLLNSIESSVNEGMFLRPDEFDKLMEIMDRYQRGDKICLRQYMAMGRNELKADLARFYRE